MVKVNSGYRILIVASKWHEPWWQQLLDPLQASLCSPFTIKCIMLSQSDWDKLRLVDRLIFISPTAVSCLAEQLPNHWQWPDDMTFFAVGESTKQALTELHWQPTYHPSSGMGAQALLDMPYWQTENRKQIAVIQGSSSNPLFQNMLPKLGWKVAYYPVYKRLTSPLPSIDTVNSWAFETAMLVITSSHGLQWISQAWQVADSILEPMAIPLLVLSDRLRDLAWQLGWYGPIFVCQAGGEIKWREGVEKFWQLLNPR